MLVKQKISDLLRWVVDTYYGSVPDSWLEEDVYPYRRKWLTSQFDRLDNLADAWDFRLHNLLREILKEEKEYFDEDTKRWLGE
jgi:hypothetical protein